MARAGEASRVPLREIAAGLSLAVLAVALAGSFEPEATRARGRRLVAGLSGRDRALREAEAFSFDPDYAAFLAEVKAATPEDATVAILVPKRPDLYVYQAYYQLAPRRVVEEKWKDEAAFIATYRTESARGPGGRPIAHGQLFAR